MSLQQRIRALKFNIQERQARLLELPPFAALVAVAVTVRRLSQPLFDLYEEFQRHWMGLQEAYNQFLAEETKRRWTWSKRNKKEMELLQTVPPYVLGALIVLLIN